MSRIPFKDLLFNKLGPGKPFKEKREKKYIIELIDNIGRIDTKQGNDFNVDNIENFNEVESLSNDEKNKK